jgi:hypothetical protein
LDLLPQQTSNKEKNAMNFFKRKLLGAKVVTTPEVEAVSDWRN